MLPKALKASFKTDIKKKYTKYLKLNVSEEEVLKYIENCRFEGQILILRELLEKKEFKADLQKEVEKKNKSQETALFARLLHQAGRGERYAVDCRKNAPNDSVHKKAPPIIGGAWII